MQPRPFVVAGAVLVFASLVSHATPLKPGQTVTPSTRTYGGTQLVTTGTQTVIAPTFTGTYTESVYADPNNALCPGCLDFVIQVTNTSPQSNPAKIIGRVATSPFTNYMVDADYDPVPNDSAPESAEWDDGGGGVIAFNFDVIGSGQTSDDLLIETNAMNYTTGYISLQDGSAMTGPLAYVPAPGVSATPEPSTLALLATGLLGIGAVGRYRRRTSL